MGEIDEACREVVSNVDGAVACGVVDLETGMLLGVHVSAAYPPGLHEIVAAAAMDLFRSDNVGRIEKMIRSRREARGSGAEAFQEVHVTSHNSFHFAKTIKGGKAAMMLVTKRTTNPGMSWAQMKAAIPKIERCVP